MYLALLVKKIMEHIGADLFCIYLAAKAVKVAKCCGNLKAVVMITLLLAIYSHTSLKQQTFYINI